MFELETLFQRSPSGRAEIYQKSHGLTQSERLVLIMIDGVTPYKELRRKMAGLSEERVNKALKTLQGKDLVLEVLLPVENQAPEQLENDVVERFLQQDPLDPVTIISLDPEEELGGLAQLAAARKGAGQATLPEPPAPAVLPSPSNFSLPLPAVVPPPVAAKEWTLVENQPAAKNYFSTIKRLHWGYWIIALGLILIVRFLFTNLSA